jgi:ubiquitin-activating enzyme E1|eukprot:COSAG06_NODE_273_length_18671_cov_15.620201_1_plen_1165_part_00
MATWQSVIESLLAAQAGAAAASTEDAEGMQAMRGDAAFMDLYSRQIGAFGLEAMLKLVKMKVLIVGVKGVGIEVAKNTTLAGVHTMGLYDPGLTELRDLGSNFFLTPDDIGKPRAQVCVPKVTELNKTVRVKEVTELSEAVVAEYSAVVFTKGTQAEAVKWNEFCRSQPVPIYFLSCFTGGATTSIFVDCGPKHTIKDRDGRNAIQKIVQSFESKEDENGKPYYLIRYITPEGQPPENFPDDGLVEFSDVGGLTYPDIQIGDEPLSLNNIHKVTTLRTYHHWKDPVSTVRLCMPDKDADGNNVYVTGLTDFDPGTSAGYMTEKKEPVEVSFKSLAERIASPGEVIMPGDLNDSGLLMFDMTFSMVEKQIHVAVQGVKEFQAKTGALPTANDAAHVDQVLALAKAFNEANKVVDEVNDEVIKKVAVHAGVELQPMCAFVGGIVAQELVKISGKFTPIMQYLNYHAFEALPETPPEDTAPANTRYDDQIAVYGRQFQEMLGDLTMFMVGCGALGCEFVKNFALMGVCCGPKGSLTITDNDRIEVSNLNRQFLFREDNVGQQKSEAAAARAHVMNKHINIKAMGTLVAPNTEDVFDESFWGGLDLVCNALDNMQAREYVDGRCVVFEKPLLESGTMGTGANVDVVVPHMTQSYTDGGAAEEGGGVPMCTLRNFPHLIDHCIEWARAQFEDVFVSPAQEAAQFLEDSEAYIAKEKSKTLDLNDASKISKAIEPLTNLKDSLASATSGATIEGCVKMAWGLFHSLFRDKIMTLISQFPEDCKTKDGKPFWSGHKKFPVVAEFSKENPTHVDFMVATTNLFASMLKVHPMKHASEKNDPSNRWQAQYRDTAWLFGVIDSLGGPPEYVKGAVADLDEEATGGAEKGDDEEGAQLAALFDELAGLAKAENIFEPADFEKDDDDNFHIDFVAACSNLRAINYRIPEAPREKAKMIAGRIIPAIATTTASVTGLVMLEMFKVLQGKPIEKLRNGNFNLGTNTYMMFEPNPASQNKDNIVITRPNAEEHPDAYDEKGELTEMYKDPEMCLGFAEWEKYYPNPHTKYDKFFIDGCSPTMTLGELKDKVEAVFADSGLSLSAIMGPTQRAEIDKDPDGDSDAQKGIGAAAAALYNSLMPATNENLPKKLGELVLEKTTRTEARPLLDPPIDISTKRM